MWSELCAGIDTRGVMGQHLIDHARQFVQTNCRVDVQRKVWMAAGFYHRFTHGSGWMEVEGLYVHPLTGLLRWKAPPKRRRYRPFEVNPVVQRLSNGNFLLRVDGIWYAVKAVLIAKPLKGEPPADFTIEGNTYRVTHKGQLSGSHLRRYDLTNSIQ